MSEGIKVERPRTWVGLEEVCSEGANKCEGDLLSILHPAYDVVVYVMRN